MPVPLRSIDHRAADDLQFIRRAMEQTATFTAVPGLGGVVMGAFGCIGAVVAAAQPTPERWLMVWLAAAGLASAAGLVAMARKARRSGGRLAGGNGRRFALALAAPFAAGAGITYALWSTATWQVLPVVWLLIYGAGVLTGGAYSVAAVRALGAGFMILGFVAALSPPAWGNVFLGVGFGGMQIAAGLYIARHHGG